MTGVLLISSAIQAQTIEIATVMVEQGASTVDVPVNFIAGASKVGSYSIVFSFNRNPPVVVSGLVSHADEQATCGGQATISATETELRIGAFEPQGGALQSALACTFTFPLDPTAVAGTYPFTLSFTQFGDLVGIGTVAGTFAPGAIVIQDPSAPPIISYAPAPTNVVTLVGGSAQIVATPSGGQGDGTSAITTVGGCAITAVAGPGAFDDVLGVNLIFVGSATTPQNIALTCSQGVAVTTGTLSCQETPFGSGSAELRWPLACPGTAIEVPSGTEFGYALLAGLLVLIGIHSVAIRSHS